MTPILALYQVDRPAWLTAVAPHMPGVVDANTDAELAVAWALMRRDFQGATWQQLSAEQRARIKRVRGVA